MLKGLGVSRQALTIKEEMWQQLGRVTLGSRQQVGRARAAPLDGVPNAEGWMGAGVIKGSVESVCNES